jgi:hypothetical protein
MIMIGKIALGITLAYQFWWWWILKNLYHGVKARNHDIIAYFAKVYVFTVVLTMAGSWYSNS